VMDAWWRAMVQERDDIVGIDAAILMHPRVWEASGHLETFTDPLVDCRNCKERWREDQIEGVCPKCGSSDFTPARAFNLMFKTNVGPVEDEGSTAYLRPETAQGIFVNFANVLPVSRRASPSAPTTTSPVTPSSRARSSSTSTRPAASATCPTWSSPRPASAAR